MKVLRTIIITLIISIATVALLSCSVENEPIGYDTPDPQYENDKTNK